MSNWRGLPRWKIAQSPASSTSAYFKRYRASSQPGFPVNISAASMHVRNMFAPWLMRKHYPSITSILEPSTCRHDVVQTARPCHPVCWKSGASHLILSTLLLKRKWGVEATLARRRLTTCPAFARETTLRWTKQSGRATPMCNTEHILLSIVCNGGRVAANILNPFGCGRYAYRCSNFLGSFSSCHGGGFGELHLPINLTYRNEEKIIL